MAFTLSKPNASMAANASSSRRTQDPMSSLACATTQRKRAAEVSNSSSDLVLMRGNDDGRDGYNGPIPMGRDGYN